jgi:hypothetical protein
MSQPLLSILIPTVVGREEEYESLVVKIYNQMPLSGVFGAIEVIKLKDNKEMTIGEKRERLYQMAGGLFSWMIDDDDSISSDALHSILDEIKLNGAWIDCITFEENCMMNGQYKRCNHSIKYDDWQDNFDGYDYVRTPFYKDVIRTQIAQSVPFEFIRYGEDHAWSRALKPKLKNEIHIPRELYYYIYNPKETHEERYGIK